MVLRTGPFLWRHQVHPSRTHPFGNLPNRKKTRTKQKLRNKLTNLADCLQCLRSLVGAAHMEPWCFRGCTKVDSMRDESCCVAGLQYCVLKCCRMLSLLSTKKRLLFFHTSSEDLFLGPRVCRRWFFSRSQITRDVGLAQSWHRISGVSCL